MRKTPSPSIRIGARLALAAAAFSAVVPAAFAQTTEHLIIGFTGGTSQAVPLSPGLTVAIAAGLAVSALVVLRRRGMRGGRLFGWLLALGAGAMLAAGGGERVISEARAILPPPAIDLTVNPGTLDLLDYWNSNIDPLTVTVTNATGQTVRITSVTTDNTDLYGITAPTTCTVTTVLAPNGTCTVTLGIE